MRKENIRIKYDKCISVIKNRRDRIRGYYSNKVCLCYSCNGKGCRLCNGRGAGKVDKLIENGGYFPW